MRICYLDCFSGISGDMLLGALVDAGADPAEIGRGIVRLALEGVSLSFEKTSRRAIAATRLKITAPDEKIHRHLSHIEWMIQGAKLAPRVEQRSLAIFRRLGEVEAAIHQIPVEKVHFHEVGAIDSIVDIVGTCLALEALRIDEIHCSPLNVGSGTVECDHGTLPVPAPATAALLAGKPVYARGPALELTTPTGAAVADALSASFGPLPAMHLAGIGYGAGGRDFPEHANVLRVLIGERSMAAEAPTVVVIEANIDDLSPQVLAYASERLMEAGALDVSLQPLVMKKGRPGTLLRVIACPEDLDRLAQLVFAETSTLGLRIYPAERRVLAREFVEVETAYGKVRMKVAETGSFAPEYEDCRRLAAETGMPLRQILSEANAAYRKRKNG